MNESSLSSPILSSFNSNKWDNFATNNIIIGGSGITTLFSKDALRLTIDENKRNESFSILEIAAGTGNLSLIALNEYSNVNILSTDYSNEMIQSLNKTIENLNLKNIKTKLIDGQNMKNEIQDNSFDYCFSIFGLIFFKDRIKGFNEINRVLKSNNNNQSKVTITTWKSSSFLPKILKLSFKKLMGFKIPFKLNLTSLNNIEKFKNELEIAGFKNIKFHSVDHFIKVNFNILKNDLFSISNPVIDEIFNLLNNDLNKFNQLILIAFNLMDELYEKDNDGYYNTQWSALIGIGEKL